MEWLFDPAIWAGLLTLVVLEIVLGIDNLIFIAILADKLPPHQRDKARLIGLSLAMLMRLGLLTIVSWLVTLTAPLFAIGPQDFSGRDLILLAGGVFLLFKATVELHERLEGVTHAHTESKVYAGFAAVVAQIVVLDAVFSLDAVITAVGMVDGDTACDIDPDEPPTGMDFHDSVHAAVPVALVVPPDGSIPSPVPPRRGRDPLPPIKPPPAA
jgi:predicted tellurium resistance membrane protein TerC